MATHVTVEGEVVDLVCRRVYGDESGFVERVLDANPGLADWGAALPAGVTIELPGSRRSLPHCRWSGCSDR